VSQEALANLGESTAEAVSSALQMFGVPGAEPRGVQVTPAGTQPFDSLPLPAVVTNVSYVEGISGGNLFAITLQGARNLAAAIMGGEPPTVEATELDEMEMSAVGEAMNQMLAAAANATSAVLGYEVDIAPPETLVITEPAQARELCEGAAHLTVAAFEILGEPAMLVQLVPTAFVVPLVEVLDGRAVAALASEAVAHAAAPLLEDAMRGVSVRVWAELGRARMPAGQVVGLPAGAVVELNREADAPIDLYVNGTLFAAGRLVVADGSEWALEIDAILDRDEAVPQ
jgi:flagellar motor switch protein FliN